MLKASLPPQDIHTDLWKTLSSTNRPILLYGMGNGADKLISRLGGMGKCVSDVFASDGFVRGQHFHGKRVLSYSEAIEKHKNPIILVCFGSALPDVLQTVFQIEEQQELYIPDMPIAGDEYFTAEFYQEHYEEIKRAYDLLEDDGSKELYVSLLWYKLTGEARFLRDAALTGDERELLGYGGMTCAVDVGAYRGDTLGEMLQNAPHLKTVLALEPDAKNFKKLSAYAATVEGRELLLFHAAAWRENQRLAFAASGNRNATLDEKKAGTASFEHRTDTVECVKIDDITCGRNVNYIKYDTEGAEMAALEGSKEMIFQSSPTMRISAYHRSEDLFSLLLWLDAFAGDRYTYHLRRRLSIPAWDIELIAVPKK